MDVVDTKVILLRAQGRRNYKQRGKIVVTELTRVQLTRSGTTKNYNKAVFTRVYAYERINGI